MRFQLNYMAMLALFLGLLLQITARAVPAIDKDARAVIPKLPGKSPTNSGGAHTGNNNNGPKTSTDSYVPTRPGGTASTVCKRADCHTVTDLEAPNYDVSTMDRATDGKTASGFVDWAPPRSAIADKADRKIFRQNLRKLALNVYDKLWKEPNGKVITGSGGYNLVAALYVPNKGVFLSTIPRENGAKAMVANWKAKAPKLHYATDGRRNGDSDSENRFHAEDGVIYEYEKRTGSKSLEEESPLFPSGTEMLVFGKRDRNDLTAGVVPPCEGKNPMPGQVVRSPSCEEVLGELHIKAITIEEAT
ncbi:hypothetical protein BDV10DRAFT_182301 [Aspergillus recurvatus]